MQDTVSSRRRFVTAGAALCGLAAVSARAANPQEEITHSCSAIHMEPEFPASRERVYAALTEPRQFEQVIALSSAVQSGMVPPGKPALIGTRPGEEFSLFAGVISGRIIEMLSGQRLVQAWRSSSWKPGIFSIAHFELVPGGSGTRIVFDHTGFPEVDAEHLLEGWRGNYWEPLRKYLR